MSTDFHSISESIVQEQKRLQENQLERNNKFNLCLDSYLKLDSTEEANDERNQRISETFENVYERIMMSSQTALRKVKETCYRKKEFWDKLIKNNADMTDLELKKDFYMQKKDADDRYHEAIDSQKVKKIPYHLLLGKIKQKNNLKEWQANNKVLEQEVVKGTQTLKNWKIGENEDRISKPYRETATNESSYFINQFATQPETGPWARTPLQASRNDVGDMGILRNFEYRRA